MTAKSILEIEDRHGAILTVGFQDGMMEVEVESSDDGKVELDETDRCKLRDFLTVNS